MITNKINRRREKRTRELTNGDEIMMTTSKIMMRLIVNIAAIYFMKMQRTLLCGHWKFKFKGSFGWLRLAKFIEPKISIIYLFIMSRGRRKHDYRKTWIQISDISHWFEFALLAIHIVEKIPSKCHITDYHTIFSIEVQLCSGERSHTDYVFI